MDMETSSILFVVMIIALLISCFLGVPDDIGRIRKFTAVLLFAITIILDGLLLLHYLPKEQKQRVERDTLQRTLWAQMSAEVKGYINNASSCEAGKKPMPYIQGKVLVVNKESLALDDLHYELSKELLPSELEDVKTIVLLKWGGSIVGEYTGGAGFASSSTCSVRVINTPGRCLVEEISFSNPPPKTIRSWPGVHIGGTGSRPTSEVLSYIESGKTK